MLKKAIWQCYDSINVLAFSPDKSLFARAGDDGMVLISQGNSVLYSQVNIFSQLDCQHATSVCGKHFHWEILRLWFWYVETSTCNVLMLCGLWSQCHKALVLICWDTNMRCFDVVLSVAISMSQVMISLVVDSQCSDVRCPAEYLLGEFWIDIGIVLRMYTAILSE